MTAAIYFRSLNDGVILAFQEAMKSLIENQCDVLIYDTCMSQLKSYGIHNHKMQSFSSAEEFREAADFMISIGGDGTILDTLTIVHDSSVPVLGINSGRLGFLTGCAAENTRAAMECLLKGTFSLDKRTVLKLDTDKNLFGAMNYALNEMTIHKKDSSSMIKIHTYLNGEYLTTYWSDGLIICTPTGSTGYSLSCGGPIVAPQSSNFVITPIAPHNLNIRPMVVSDKNVITLEVEGRSQFFLTTLDSRSVTVDSSIQFAVRLADFTFNIIRLYDDNFLKTLRNKLNWGLDTRN
ncbi:MAG: NAD kinase [Bacteroidia bacterium]|nr:NAD kinase [Bacteroidia bacterium]